MSEQTTFLDVNFEGVEELKLFDTDEEVNLTVIRAEMHMSKESDSQSLHCLFKSTDRPGHELIHCYMPNPEPNPDNQADIADKNQQKLLKRKRFFTAFGIDLATQRIDLTDPVNNALVGRSGWVVVGIEQDQSGQYPDKNFIKRFVRK